MCKLCGIQGQVLIEPRCAEHGSLDKLERYLSVESEVVAAPQRAP
jgi:hypothetical protein